MDRINDPTATEDRKFQEASGATPATRLRAPWLNGVQEELLHIIEEEGLAPSGADLTQLKQALDRRFPRQVATITELLALTGVASGQQVSVLGCPFIYQSGGWVPLSHVPVEAFGADPTGVDDSHLALEDAVESGWPIDWGDGSFSVSGQIGSLAKTLTVVDWKSNGATVSMDGASHVEAVLAYSVAAGIDVNLSGCGLEFNGNNLANTGAYFLQDTADRTTVVKMERLAAKNLRRDPTFTTSDGIRFSGGFRYIELCRPSVDTMALPPGAGTSGVVGVHGITLSRSSTDGAHPYSSKIIHPYVKDIFSEDATYQDDQDGMRLFGDVDDAGREDTLHTVEGGEFINCWGRDIKIQAPWAKVAGTVVRHTTGPSVGMGFPVIDFQNGAGEVSGIRAYFDGQEPPSVVNFGSAAAGIESTAKLRDSFVRIENGELSAIVRGFTTNASSGLPPIEMDNVRVIGAVTNPLTLLTPNDEAYGTLIDVQCNNITDAMAKVVAQGGSSPYKAFFTFIKCINSGAQVPLARGRVPGNAADFEISEFDCYGFAGGAGRINPTDQTKSGTTRLRDIAGFYNNGGVMRLDAVELADAGTHNFPIAGYSSGVQMAMVSMNRSANEQGLIAFDSGGVDLLAAGVNVNNGTTSDPGSGNLRLWVDGVTGELVVSNNSGATRVITVMFFG